MSQLALADLKEHVRRLLEQTSLADLVKDVRVEPSDHFDDVLRVIVSLPRPEKLETSRLLTVTRRIEDELSELDDRFPDVRYAEAA